MFSDLHKNCSWARANPPRTEACLNSPLRTSCFAALASTSVMYLVHLRTGTLCAQSSLDCIKGHWCLEPKSYNNP